MAFFNTLLISTLLLGWDGFLKTQSVGVNCPDFRIDYSLDQPQIGQFSLNVIPKSGKAPFKIVLSEESGQLISEDFTKTKFENLKKGKYICLVVDADKCLAKTEINVEP